MNAPDYCDTIKLKLATSPIIKEVHMMQERNLEDRGFFRARLRLVNESGQLMGSITLIDVLEHTIGGSVCIASTSPHPTCPAAKHPWCRRSSPPTGSRRWGRSTRWLTVITIDPKQFGADREMVRLALEAENIEARPLWKPMHMQPVFQECEVVGGVVALSKDSAYPPALI